MENTGVCKNKIRPLHFTACGELQGILYAGQGRTGVERKGHGYVFVDEMAKD